MARDSDADRAALVALASLPKMGPRRLEALVHRDGCAGAWEQVLAGVPALPVGLRRALGPAAADVVSGWRQAARSIDPAELLRAHTDAGVEVLVLGSDRFPSALAADSERPMALFVRGRLDRLVSPRVAIVGTRRATGGGLRTAEVWGRTLTAAGVQVVSGLALGVDGAAHRGALAALDADPHRSAPPVGVVGTGLDVVYPRRHRALWERVGADGILLSEVPLGGQPTRWRFPARNRLIAALSDLVIVVESHESGGALSTAEAAAERGRTVMAVPGSIHSSASAGTNRLLAEGALPACSVDDVLTQLELSSCDRLARTEPTAAEPDASADGLEPADRALLDHLGWDATGLDRLALELELGVGELAVRLTRLEVRGLVRLRPGFVEKLSS